MTIPKTKTNALLKHYLAGYGVTALTYYDRLKIYVDAKTKRSKLVQLVSQNPKNSLRDQALIKNEHLVYALDLFLPNPKLIKSIIQGDSAITYAEIDLDFICGDQTTLNGLITFFNRFLVHIPNTRLPIHYENINDETTYFSPSSAEEGYLFYNDSPSRNGPPNKCQHLEMRLKNWATVKKYNIITPNDLLNFDIDKFWDNVLDLRKPNFTELGKLSSHKEMSRQSYHDYGKQE